MLRQLCLLLLLVLPLQFGWNVVAAYCGHGDRHDVATSADPSAHVGHVAPAFGAHADSDDGAAHHHGPADNGDITTHDGDHCHGHGAMAMFVASPFVSAAPGLPVATFVGARPPAFVAARPERPQWARLA